VSVYLAVYTIHLSSPRFVVRSDPCAGSEHLVRRLTATPKVEMGLGRRLIVHCVKPILGVYDDDEFSYGLGIKVGHWGSGSNYLYLTSIVGHRRCTPPVTTRRSSRSYTQNRSRHRVEVTHKTEPSFAKRGAAAASLRFRSPDRSPRSPFSTRRSSRATI